MFHYVFFGYNLKNSNSKSFLKLDLKTKLSKVMKQKKIKLYGKLKKL